MFWGVGLRIICRDTTVSNGEHNGKWTLKWELDFSLGIVVSSQKSGTVGLAEFRV